MLLKSFRYAEDVDEEQLGELPYDYVPDGLLFRDVELDEDEEEESDNN